MPTFAWVLLVPSPHSPRGVPLWSAFRRNSTIYLRNHRYSIQKQKTGKNFHKSFPVDLILNYLSFTASFTVLTMFSAESPNSLRSSTAGPE